MLRSWGKANADTLTRYIQANVEGIRWALDPKNRAALTTVVAQRLKLPPDVVAESLKIADAQKGFAVNSRFDMEGFRNVLQLRADMLGTWGGKPPAPDKYLDLSYYDRALKGCFRDAFVGWAIERLSPSLKRDARIAVPTQRRDSRDRRGFRFAQPTLQATIVR